MSFEGFSNSRSDQRPASSGAVDAGVKGPQRDAWNQVIEPVQQRQQQQTDPNNPDAGANDDGINDKDIDSIWADVKKEGSKPADSQVPNNQQQQQQPVTKTPEVQMREYLDSVGLQPIEITDADKEKMQAGDFSGFLGNVNQKISQAHIKAISGSKQLMEAMIGDAVKKAVGDSKDYVEGRASLDALHTALPFTRNPAIGPVAQTVMQRFLNKGATREEAIKGVKKWSETFVKAFDPNYVDVSPNRNRNGNFSSVNNSEGGDADWVSVLNGKS